MVMLPEGDSTTPAMESVQGSESPDAVADDKTQTQQAQAEPKVEPEPKPVILAKDGVHTIPFEQLEAAREAERQARAAEEALRAEIAQLQAQLASKPAPETQAVPTTPEPGIDKDLFGDFSEEALAKGVELVVERRTAALTAQLTALHQQLQAVAEPLQRQQVDSATKAHFDAIHAKHADSDALVQSAAFAAWIEAQPSFSRDGLKAVVAQGTAEQVIEMLDAYRKSAGSPSQPEAASVAAAAQAAIAKAKSAPPSSLSEIPAGSQAHHDEAASMLEKSPQSLMSMFDGKSPEQISALMSRAL